MAVAARRPTLMLVFGSTAQVTDSGRLSSPRCTRACGVVACSTAGELADVELYEDGLVATAIALEHGRIEVAAVALTEAGDSAALGALLASRLPPAGLVHVLVLSEGLKVNGRPGRRSPACARCCRRPSACRRPVG